LKLYRQLFEDNAGARVVNYRSTAV